MNQLKPVEKVIEVPRQVHSKGLSLAHLDNQLLVDYLDPFLMFDHFQMTEPVFRPHPHAGFSAVTYMFPKSKNGFVNRDSLGNRNMIQPGAIHWTVAGRGVIHEEVPIERGLVCDGLQIFVNLHSSRKFIKPYALHAEPHEIPRVETEHSEVRVVVGEHQGRRSFFEPPVEVQILDVVLRPGGEFRHDVPEGYLGFLYALEGRGTIRSGPGNEVAVHEHQAVGLGASGTRIEVFSESSAFHFVLGLGQPLREPVVFQGPFCMNTREQIQQVIQEYQSGHMGRLESSF